MRELAVFDAADYPPGLDVRRRVAVRSIIMRGDKLVMVTSLRYGEVKFPGGGVHPGEEYRDALFRETREETGLLVVPGSVREFGTTVERRLDKDRRRVFEHLSLYYVCGVENKPPLPLQLDDYESEYGYTVVEVTPEEALERNEEAYARLSAQGEPAANWTRREAAVLRVIVSEKANTIQK